MSDAVAAKEEDDIDFAIKRAPKKRRRGRKGKGKGATSNGPTVIDLVKKFDESDRLSLSAREWSEKCRDYYDGNQHTSAELAIFQDRKQPPTVNNRIAPMVDFLLGIELRSRTDPKVYPRSIDQNAEKDAEAVTDALRFTLDNNFFDNIASEVFENFLLEGPGGASVEVEKMNGKREIVIRKMPFSRMFFDPYSVQKQKGGSPLHALYNDCQYTGLISWMDISEVVSRWNLDEDVEKALRDAATTCASGASGASSETYDDVPRWYDKSDRERVMVVEMYFRQAGVWHHAIFAKDTYLVEPKASGYKDCDGKPTNPHILACPKVSRKGEHYSPVKTKLSIQDDINKRHSRATDLMTRRQTFGKEGAISDINKFKREANSSGGHIEFPAGPGKFGEDYGFVPNESLSAAEFNMFKDAITQIESLARAGIAADNETNMSGKALGKLQTSRNLEIQPLVEVHSTWKIRVYRAVWERIKQYWTEERWIRVTDDEENTKFVGINRQANFGDVVSRVNGGKLPKAMRGNKDLGRPMRATDGTKPLMNQVSKMDVDIFVEEVPDVTYLQEEVFEQMIALYQANPEAVPFDKIIKLSPLRTKQKRELTSTEMTPEQEEAAKAKQAERQELQQIQKQGAVAKVRRDMAAGAKDMSSAQQTEIENRILETFPIEPTQLSI